jgi:hypothetical protein
VSTGLDRASAVGGGLAFAIFWLGGLLDRSLQMSWEHRFGFAAG